MLFLLFFFFKNNFFVGRFWVGRSNRMNLVDGLYERSPNCLTNHGANFFKFLFSLGARWSGSGPEAFSQPIFAKNQPKSTHYYISTLAIIWLIQFFNIFVTWDIIIFVTWDLGNALDAQKYGNPNSSRAKLAYIGM